MPTFDDQFDDMRHLSDDVRKGTRVGTSVSALQSPQLDPVAVDSYAVVAGRHQFAAVLAPRQ